MFPKEPCLILGCPLCPRSKKRLKSANEVVDIELKCDPETTETSRDFRYCYIYNIIFVMYIYIILINII